MRADVHEHELMTAWSRALNVRLMPIPNYFTKPFDGTPTLVSDPRVQSAIWHGDHESGLILHYPRGVVTDDMAGEFHSWRLEHGIELIKLLDGWRSGYKAMILSLAGWESSPGCWEHRAAVVARDLMEPTDEVRPHG